MAITKGAKSGLAIIAFLLFVVWLANVRTPSTSPSSGAQPVYYGPDGKEVAAPTASVPPSSKKLLLTERLAIVKRLLRKRPSNDGDILVALRHLRTIPATAPEYSEAQRLLKKPKLREAFARIRRETLAQQRAADILKNPIVVVRSNWNKGGFGSVALWTVTFRNRSPRRVGDIRYETKYWTETDRLIGRGSGTIGKIVQARRMRKLEINDGFIQSDAARASFTIVGWRYLETETMAKARAERERTARAAKAKARAERERAAKAARVERERTARAASAKAQTERLNEARAAIAAAVKAGAVVVFVPDASATFCSGQNPAYRQYIELKGLAYMFTTYPPAGASQAVVDEWREKLDRLEKATEEGRDVCNDGLR